MSKLQKLAAGDYLYGEFRIRRCGSEYGSSAGQWDILEETPGGWVACDRFPTLAKCKEVLAKQATRGEE